MDIQGKSKTDAQTVSYLFDSNELTRESIGTYAQLRQVRKDPTVSLGRGLLVSGIMAGSWSIESTEDAPEGVIDFVKSLLPLREGIMKNAVSYGRVDFGYQGFEQIFFIEDGLITVRLKPLLHDISTILIDRGGNFMGYRQTTAQSALPIDVPVEQCLHIAFDVEGSNHYGIPLLENIRATQASWDDCDSGAKRYDTKIAGSHFVVHYPPGTSEVEGETVDNAEIAKQLLTALESSGSMALPSTTADFVQELGEQGVADLFKWDVTLISDLSARQPAFSDRLKYLDSLKIRGLILPERSMLEGKFGTKAESGVHAGLAITGMENIDKHITKTVNEQVVEPLLALNFGDKAQHQAWLVASPLVDLKIEFLRKLYMELVPNEIGTIDSDALKESLQIPIKKEEEVEEEVLTSDSDNPMIINEE